MRRRPRAPLSPARRWVLAVGVVLSVLAIAWGALLLINLLGRTTEDRSAHAARDRRPAGGVELRRRRPDHRPATSPDIRVVAHLEYGLSAPRLRQESGPDGVHLDASLPVVLQLLLRGLRRHRAHRDGGQADSSGGSVTVRGRVRRHRHESSGGSITVIARDRQCPGAQLGRQRHGQRVTGGVDLNSSGGGIVGNRVARRRCGPTRPVAASGCLRRPAQLGAGEQQRRQGRGAAAAGGRRLPGGRLLQRRQPAGRGAHRSRRRPGRSWCTPAAATHGCCSPKPADPAIVAAVSYRRVFTTDDLTLGGASYRRVFATDDLTLGGVRHALSNVYAPCREARVTVGGTPAPGVTEVDDHGTGVVLGVPRRRRVLDPPALAGRAPRHPPPR